MFRSVLRFNNFAKKLSKTVAQKKVQEVISRIFCWYWCYYPHRSRDSLCPVGGIFFYQLYPSYNNGWLRNLHINLFQIAKAIIEYFSRYSSYDLV